MKNKKVGLIILDGLGYSTNKHGNAFIAASTPTIDYLLANYPHSTLGASQSAVGLPLGQMGNSEVGHLNIGAGRTIKADLVKINDEIAEHKFAFNPNLLKAIEGAKIANKKFHIIGLTSKGGVHSQLNHILETIKVCGKANVKTVLHCFSDGRDVGTKDFIEDLKVVLDTIKQYPNITIGTIGGRYYGMDRNQNWDRINLAIDAMLNKGLCFSDPLQYVKDSYAKNETDEFIKPAFNASAKDIKLELGDYCFFANFRPDRARQLSHCIKQSGLYQQGSVLWPLNLTLVTMVKYDGIDSDIVLYPPINHINTLGEVLTVNGLKQLRIAETEKYAHVTFFFDGGKEMNYVNEDKILIPSPSVATYDLKPEMSAFEIKDKLIANMDKYDVVICNFANCDMVGHTGNWDATVKAVQTVDTCLKAIVDKANEIGMTLFITADHGNCDQMLDENNKPVTTHSLANVFFICTDKNIKLKDGTLANIAPTILKYLNITKPIQMDKDSLIK